MPGKKKPTNQEELIGKHPVDGFFATWLDCNDIDVTEEKKHRSLSEKEAERDNAINQLADWLITHHLGDRRQERMERKKEILDTYGYKEYLKFQKIFPDSDRTKKGNFTEILLSEYLQVSSGLKSLVFRLRFNPNVDQSMKGDDVLLFDMVEMNRKIILGEAKYRGTPTAAIVNEIVDAFNSKDRLPLSITFVAERMSELGNNNLADKLEDLNAEMYKLKIPIIHTGFLLSNPNASRNVEANTKSSNENFVILSLGMNNLQEFVDKSFELALDKLAKQ